MAPLVVLALLASLPATAHETQSSPNTTNINVCGGAGNACLNNNFVPDTCDDDEATGCYLANYSGSDSTYVGNIYPFPTSGSPNLNQTVSWIKNDGVSCTIYLRDLPGFAGWTKSVARGVATNLTGTYANDTSSHHWCASS